MKYSLLLDGCSGPGLRVCVCLIHFLGPLQGRILHLMKSPTSTDISSSRCLEVSNCEWILNPSPSKIKPRRLNSLLNTHGTYSEAKEK